MAVSYAICQTEFLIGKVTVQPPPGQRIVLWRRPWKGAGAWRKDSLLYLSLAPLLPFVERERASKENDALSGRRLSRYSESFLQPLHIYAILNAGGLFASAGLAACVRRLRGTHSQYQ